MSARTRAQRAASFQLVAALLERDGAAAEDILRGRSTAGLADMMECLAGLADVTTRAVTAAGAEPPADEDVQRRVVDLVTEVTGPLDGATTHLLWQAFRAGEPPAVLADKPEAGVLLLAACNAVAGEDWSGTSSESLARQYRLMASLAT